MANSKYAAFIAAAEEGNMTAAAQKLGYTQSGVSHLVHTLEQELGVQLLIRSKAGVELSPEGNALIGHIRRLIAAENAVLGAAGVAAMGVGVSAKAEESATYVPGTYTATAQGYAGDVTVTMTFSESAITDVVINAAGETAGIGDKVAAEMPALILEHQSVDVATSATGAYTRSAVQKAAQKVLC